jgi:2'-5' RNA ligase
LLERCHASKSHASLGVVTQEHPKELGEIRYECQIVQENGQITYQGALSYEETPLRSALKQIAHKHDRFEVETDGICILTGPNPVLYLAVLRSPVLTEIHQHIWQALETVGVGITPIYGPQHWIPHITLAQGDMTHRHLPALMQMLSPRTFSWRIPITNLAVIKTTSDVPDAAYAIATDITFKLEEQRGAN